MEAGDAESYIPEKRSNLTLDKYLKQLPPTKYVHIEVIDWQIWMVTYFQNVMVLHVIYLENGQYKVGYDGITEQINIPGVPIDTLAL